MLRTLENKVHQDVKAVSSMENATFFVDDTLPVGDDVEQTVPLELSQGRVTTSVAALMKRGEEEARAALTAEEIAELQNGKDLAVQTRPGAQASLNKLYKISAASLDILIISKTCNFMISCYILNIYIYIYQVSSKACGRKNSRSPVVRNWG